MYKNYFYLLRCVKELNVIIREKRIEEAYSQEKDKLFLSVPTGGNPDSHLIISADQHHPSLIFKSEHHKAKKNSFNFCPQKFPAFFETADIASAERVIRINLNNGKLIFMIRGGQSNVFFIDNESVIIPFKKIVPGKKESLSKELTGFDFISTDEDLEKFLQMLYAMDGDALKKFPPIGKEIIGEAERRNGSFTENLAEVVNEVLSGPIAVFYDDETGKLRFIPAGFKSVKIPPESAVFESYNPALENYFRVLYTGSNKRNTRREIEKHLSAEFEKLSDKLNNLKAFLGAGSKEEFYKKCADLLLMNISSLRKGMKDTVLTEVESGEKVKIMLDEKLSPRQNINSYYDKSRNAKIGYSKSSELYDLALKEYSGLLRIRERFEGTNDEEKLIAIRKELKMKTQESSQNKNEDKGSFRHYLIEGKYHLYVGKDSRNNDLLTTRYARQNDYWFHARSVSGSHVVLKVENVKEPVPKSILQKAAAVTAFYSKAKTSKLAPVTYTLKKYVIKNQRHNPGEVTLTKENVLLVKPEIPRDCEPLFD
jgi:predicted ribosome quality control (RQC) complex YloA/Tae2 family protein